MPIIPVLFNLNCTQYKKSDATGFSYVKPKIIKTNFTSMKI